MSSSHEKMTEHTNHTVLNAQGEHGLGGNTSNGPVERDVVTGDIDPEDEVKGVKLLILHIGLCLCTFLVGLVWEFLKNVVRTRIADHGRRTLRSLPPLCQ